MGKPINVEETVENTTKIIPTVKIKEETSDVDDCFIVDGGKDKEADEVTFERNYMKWTPQVVHDFNNDRAFQNALGRRETKDLVGYLYGEFRRVKAIAEFGGVVFRNHVISVGRDDEHTGIFRKLEEMYLKSVNELSIKQENDEFVKIAAFCDETSNNVDKDSIDKLEFSEEIKRTEGFLTLAIGYGEILHRLK